VAIVHFWSRLAAGVSHPAGPHLVDTLVLAVVIERDGTWRVQAAENVTRVNPVTGCSMAKLTPAASPFGKVKVRKVSTAAIGTALANVTLTGLTNIFVSGAMEDVGGDGFLITDPELTCRYISENADHLIPALQKQGAVRQHYAHIMPQDNLR
jgi:hypothetical protein